jgi:CubicO group peptidase (beta-lactamase class C family)
MSVYKSLFQSLADCAMLRLALPLSVLPAQAKQTSDSAANGTSFDDIDVYIQQQIDRLNIPGATLVIVEGNEIVHLRGFGQARPGGDVPSPKTPFVLGSVTKSFTALAVMQLVKAGAIELDAPVQRYLPWFQVADPQASAQITVRHLLNQTSGLPMSIGMIILADFDSRPDATERQARALSTLVLTRPVGSAFEYCNMNYNLLGLIIEAASGESYTNYIQRHIFDPLGMSHSYTSQAVAQQNGLAVGHRYWFAFPFAVPNLPLPSGSLPAGLLISSTEDMGHYLIAHLNEGRYGGVQILSGAGIDELHRPVVEFRAMGFSFGHYGMGWFTLETGESRIVWHSGTLPDFFAFMALLPKQNKGMVLLVNANHLIMDKLTLTEVGMSAAQRLTGEPPAPNRGAVVPWVLRGMLLIPVFQIVGVAGTLRLLRRWREDPKRCPSGLRKWVLHILLPLIPNLLVAPTLIPMLGNMRRFLMLYVPDFSWIAFICGGSAGIWTFLRTGLILRTLRRPSRRQ